jgi:hypothetical protein
LSALIAHGCEIEPVISFLPASSSFSRDSKFKSRLSDHLQSLPGFLRSSVIRLLEQKLAIMSVATLHHVDRGGGLAPGSRHLSLLDQQRFSVRFKAKGGRGNAKVLVYFIHFKTVRILDVEMLMTIEIVSVLSKFDWLELALAGTMLFVRDSKRSLYLSGLDSKNLSELLTACSDAQLVPKSKVVVAEITKLLSVSYSSASRKAVCATVIEGDVVLSRMKTAVSTFSNGEVVQFALDRSFIAFPAAMKRRSFVKRRRS